MTEMNNFLLPWFGLVTSKIITGTTVRPNFKRGETTFVIPGEINCSTSSHFRLSSSFCKCNNNMKSCLNKASFLLPWSGEPMGYLGQTGFDRK